MLITLENCELAHAFDGASCGGKETSYAYKSNVMDWGVVIRTDLAAKVANHEDFIQFRCAQRVLGVCPRSIYCSGLGTV